MSTQPRPAWCVCALAALLLWGCGNNISNNVNPDTDATPDDVADVPPQVLETTPVFDPDGEGFYATPWPSDARLIDGKVSLDGFPRSNGGVIQVFRRVLETIEGFGNMAVVYIQFDARLGDASMPTPPESITPQSHVQLIDVSPEGCGQRVPLDTDMDKEGDDYIPANTLRVSVLPGHALNPETTYAAVVLKGFGEASNFRTLRPEGFQRAWDGEGPFAASLEPLRDCLPKAGIDEDDIAIATVFTTQDPTASTRALRDAVLDPEQTEAPQITEWAIVQPDPPPEEPPEQVVYAGKVRVPIFQKGSPPYNRTGEGLIEFDDAGLPVVQRYEEIPFTLTFDRTVNSEGRTLPVLLWSDGTGAGLLSHVGDDHIVKMVNRGWAVLNFVPQFHEPRAAKGTSPELPTFNYTNPSSGRSVFRQQAAESLYMLRVIREALQDQEGVPALDGERVLYGGHSQGAIVGALVAGISDDFAAYAINGVGGYLSSTIIYRKDYIDIEATLRSVLNVKRKLDRKHPTIQLAQLGVEPVDPINYAPYWVGREGVHGGSHMLISNGARDPTTAQLGMSALLVEGMVPPLSDASWELDRYGITGLDAIDGEIQGNRTGTKGQTLTHGAFLLQNQGHFSLYRSARVEQLFVDFWVQAYEGTPVIK